MNDIYKVAIHYEDVCGQVAYDPNTKTITVVLDDAQKRREVEEYLSQVHIIPVAQNTLRDFKPVIVNPSESVESFKLAMSYLWQHTEVMVDWSRPPDWRRNSG